MSMTQEEAKNLWCPFARLVGSSDGCVYCNRPNDASAGNTNCIGSDCMAWRLDRYRETGNEYGYCGLAGKP